MKVLVLGIFLVLNALLFAIYWMTGDNPHKAWVLLICIVIVMVGMFFTLHERAIEITFKGVGKITAAAKQAASDADAISDIKKRIEAQSATVDLIAEEASEAIKQVKNVALTTAKANLTDLMAANFMDGTTLKVRLGLHDRIIDNLKEIGISENDILEADEMWRKGIGIIYFRGIHKALEGRVTSHQINTKASPELLKASKDFNKMLNFELWQTPSPEEMINFINSKGFMNDEVSDLIADYKYYIETGIIQRREVFEQL